MRQASPALHPRHPRERRLVHHRDLRARASTEAKRQALEIAYTDTTSHDLPEWAQNHGLLRWLTNL
jgi:hypothetical protein